MEDNKTNNDVDLDAESVTEQTASESHPEQTASESTTTSSQSTPVLNGLFRDLSSVDSWTKLSIFIFSLLSFITTMNGMKIFFPADEIGILGLVGSLLASLAVQALMLSFAFRVKQEGVKRSLILMYSLAAIISMSFSYIGLFKYYSGGFLNEEQREQFDSEFIEYSQDLGSYLSTARNELELAISVATEAANAEYTTGGATALKSTSPYFNTLLDDAGLDLQNRASEAGQGPIYIWLTVTAAAMKSQLEQIDELYGLQMELAKSGRIFQGSREAKIQSAYDFESAADWLLLERIVVARGAEFQRPVLPVMPEIGGATGSGASRHDEIKWSVHAFRATREEWNNPVVAIPELIAIALDLVVLLIAIIFRDSKRLKPDQIAIRKSIARVLETMGMAESELYSGLHAILHFADGRGSGGRQKWTLHADAVERMSPSGKRILLQLARSRLAKEPWYQENLVLSGDVHSCLNEHYLRMQSHGLRAES